MPIRATGMSLLVLASAATASSLTLKYFDARGAAETTRVLLTIGGIAYTDQRYPIGPGFEAPEFKADKESGGLARNLGRAPLLLTDEGAIGQSKAMERYVAGQAGLMGKTPFEAACIDMVAEHVRDVREAQARKGFSRMARGKTDDEKAALAAEWYSTDPNPNPSPSPNPNPNPNPNTPTLTLTLTLTVTLTLTLSRYGTDLPSWLAKIEARVLL